MLLNCLGRPDLVLDAGTLAMENGDLVLPSTDALHDWIPQAALAAILEKQSQLEEKLAMLPGAASTAGSKDDVTVVAVQL